MADPRKPSSKELDAKKIAGEVRLSEIAARRLRVERQYQRLQKNEIKNADELSKLHKEALRLTALEQESKSKVVDLQGKQNSLLHRWKDELGGRVKGFLDKELSIVNQLDFVWERVRHGAELYGKMQGSLPALTGKQLSEIEKLNKKIAEGGLSAESALAIFESMPGILDDVKKAAKSVAHQQFLMAESARDSALRYGQTYDAVRKLQKTVQQTLAIRVVDKGTRKDVEMVTDSLLYMEDRGIMPVSDALKNVTKLSRQFGVGTTAAVQDSANELEKLARIPDTLSDRMKKSEGVIGRFFATNREDFLRIVLELNEAYGTQSTILKNVGATFASLTMEARKYGAQAETAANVAKGLSSALMENTEDSHIAFLAGEKLAERLRTEPDLMAKMTRDMPKEMRRTVEELVAEGGIGAADLSKIFATTTEGMVERMRVIKDLYGGQDLAVTARLLSSIPGLNLKKPEEQLTAARMIKEGKGAEEIIAAIQNLQRTSEKDSQAKRRAEEKTLKATHTIGEPLRAVETQWQATKEIAFRGAAEALGKDSEDNIRKVAVGATVTAAGVTVLSKYAGRFWGWLTKGKGAAETARTVSAEGKATGAATARALEKSRELLSAESKIGQTIAKMKGGKESLKVLSKIPGGAQIAKMIAGGGAVGTKLAGLMASGPGKLLGGAAKALGPALFGYDLISGGMGEAATQAYKSMFGGENMDWDKLASNLGEGGLKALTSGGLLMEPGAWIARNITAPATGMKPEEAEKLFREYMDVEKWMEGMAELGSSAYGWTHGETPTTNVRGIQSTAPTVTNTRAKDVTLNPDGSATVKTLLEIDQQIPGFADAVANAQAQAGASKRYGG